MSEATALVDGGPGVPQVDGVVGAPRVMLRPRLVLTRFRIESLAPADTDPVGAGCLVCGGVERDVFTRLRNADGESGLERAICHRCGHIAFSRMPNQEWFRNFYRTSFEHTGAPPSEPPSLDYSVVSDLVEALEPNPEARILDVGCGYGSALRHLAARGYGNMAGLEISDRRAAVAAKTGFPIAHTTGEEMLSDPVLTDLAPFDVAYSYHTFEHVFDPYEALANVAKLVRPGGHVMVVVPHADAEHLVQMAHYLPHIHSFSESSLGALMNRCGLDVVYQDNSLRIVGRKRPADAGSASGDGDPAGERWSALRLRQKFIRDFGLRDRAAVASPEALVRFTDYRGSREILEASHGSIAPVQELPLASRTVTRAAQSGGLRRRAALSTGPRGPVQGPAVIGAVDAALETDSATPLLEIEYAGAHTEPWTK